MGQAGSLSGDRGRVTVVLLGHHVEGIAKEYSAHGAQRVLWVDHPQLASYRADLFTTLISDLIQEHQPAVFLVGASDLVKSWPQDRQATRSRLVAQIASLWIG